MPHRPSDACCRSPEQRQRQRIQWRRAPILEPAAIVDIRSVRHPAGHDAQGEVCSIAGSLHLEAIDKARVVGSVQAGRAPVLSLKAIGPEPPRSPAAVSSLGQLGSSELLLEDEDRCPSRLPCCCRSRRPLSP